jgi:uncharacterized protein YdeI (YjbR/CyaY-like superfamily)
VINIDSVSCWPRSQRVRSTSRGTTRAATGLIAVESINVGPSPTIDPVFFKTASHLRRWLERNHDKARELWIGMYRQACGKRGITYRDALDEALCFGWIDGVRKRFDDESYVQRFTPRQAKSYWSAVNTKRAEELRNAGRMHGAGVAAFERRDGEATRRYSFEREAARLDPAMIREFQKNRKAWAFFEAQAPWYRRVTAHWVTSAKREETRQRRLAALIKDSAAGRRIGLLGQKKNG